MRFARIARAVFLFILCFLLFVPEVLAEPTPAPTLPPFDPAIPIYDENRPEDLLPEQLYAEAAILINRADGRVLFEKNADAIMSPASTTKIMTLMLALEYYGDYLYEVVTIPPEAADIPADSSKVPIVVGDEMTFIDLLYGFMLKSGNDAGNAIAVIVAGSIDAFVGMMNQKAAELGMTNTHYVNAHGYTADGHYTTARDMAILTRAAMEDPTFRKIVSTGVYPMAATNMREEVAIENTNTLVVYGSKYRYDGANGVKTGNTSAAGQCVVSSASRNGIDLISVVMKSTITFPPAKWQDSHRILDYGYSQYKTYSFDDLYNLKPVVVPISNASESDPNSGVLSLDALINRTGSYSTTVHIDDLPQALADFQSRLKVEYTRDFEAPVEMGAIMGNLSFTAEDGTVISAVLVADRVVEAAPKPASSFKLDLSFLNTLPSSTRYILLVCVAFFLIFVVTLIVARVNAARRRRRRRQMLRQQRERVRRR